MKKLFAGIFVALSMLAATVAHAANIVETQAITFVDNTSDLGHKFGSNTQNANFTEKYTFSSSSNFDVSAAVISIKLSTKELNITSLTLTDGTHTITGTKTTVGDTQYFKLSGSNLLSGNYTLAVSGVVLGKGGSYGGNISISPVPEASTTAMMLGGLVIVALAALRRRRQDGGAARGNMAFA